MRKPLLILVCMFAACAMSLDYAWSQDIHFSQMDVSAMSSSWARIGDYQGDGSVTIANRSQWRSVSGVPYQTQFIQGEMKSFKNRLHWGGSVHHDKAGDGVWRQTQLSMGVGYQCWSDTNKFNLILAMAASWMQWTWNPELLTWGNQWDGFQWNEAAGSGEYFATQSQHAACHAGIDFRLRWNERWRTQCSWGGFNIISSNVDMGLSRYNWYPRSVFQQTTRFTIHPKNNLSLQSVWMIQKPSQSKMIWLKDQIIMDERDWNFWGINVGLGARSLDAVVMQVGGFFRQHEVGFAYDVNHSDLMAATQGRGAWEMYYRWIWRKPRILAKKEICPEYY